MKRAEQQALSTFHIVSTWVLIGTRSKRYSAHRHYESVGTLVAVYLARRSNLLGGMKAWTALDLRTEKGAERSVSTQAIEGTRS